MPHLTKDSFQLFYEEKGEGELLVILPGNTASSASHVNEIEHFSKKFHTVAIDFRGTGKSDRLYDWEVSWFEQNADDVSYLIECLGEKQAVLIGTSGGAVTALLTAIMYPEKVKAVIADSCCENFDPLQLSEEVRNRDFRSPPMIDFWRNAHGEDWRSVVEEDNKFLLKLAKSGGDIFCGNLKKIRCPVLLTGSTKDTHLKNIADELTNMARQIPHANLFLVNEGDHPLMWSAPKVFNLRSDMFLNYLN